MGGGRGLSFGFRGEGWVGDAMAVDREVPEACERVGVLVVAGL